MFNIRLLVKPEKNGAYRYGSRHEPEFFNSVERANQMAQNTVVELKM
jgi:hypothetical protein